MSYSQVITKKITDMSTAELKERANTEAVNYYRAALVMDPQNPQARYEYEQACHRASVAPDPEVNRLYSLPLDKLKAEFETKGQAVEDNSLEAYRVKQAEIWMASQGRYAPNPAAAKIIVDRVNSLGLRGSVHELQFVFEQLVAEGKIDAPPEPVELYTREQLDGMSAAEMKVALQRMGY